MGPEQALEIFAEMQRRGFQPDVITYNALISACEKACKPEKARELFAEMQGRGLQTDGIACNARGMQFRYWHVWRSWAAAIGCPRRLDLGNKFERCTSSLH